MRTFLAVVRAGSFGKAARALGTSQPSVGRHVKQLEEALGEELFERSARELRPTALALALAEEAAGMEAGAKRAADFVARRRADTSARVRISASRMAAACLLPEILAALRRHRGAPAVELAPDDGLVNLAQREADIAVRLVRPARSAALSRRVGTIHFGMYAAKSYAAIAGVPKTPADLAAHAIVGFDRSPQMVRGARRLGLAAAPEAFAFRCDDRVIHVAAIRAGVGVGVLPTYLGERDPTLVRVLPDLALTPSGVWLVALREVLARGHVRAVYDLLREGIARRLGDAPRVAGDG